MKAEYRCLGITKKGIRCRRSKLSKCNKFCKQHVTKTECSICYADFYSKKLFETSCKHSFCIPCMTNWTLVNISCPLCRSKDIGDRTVLREYARSNKLIVGIKCYSYNMKEMVSDYKSKPSTTPEDIEEFDALVGMMGFFRGRKFPDKQWNTAICPTLCGFMEVDDLNAYRTEIFGQFVRTSDVENYEIVSIHSIDFD